MANQLRTFASLYSTTLLTVLAGGLLTTYLGLRLSVIHVPQLWIGGMMSAYYVGLVAGSKIGHRLIAQVGHIRAFVASAGIVAACALGHALVDQLAVWLLLRLIVGMGMMCQYMVLESWLNEQAESSQRGTVFASYMIVSYFGLILGHMHSPDFFNAANSPRATGASALKNRSLLAKSSASTDHHRHRQHDCRIFLRSCTRLC